MPNPKTNANYQELYRLLDKGLKPFLPPASLPIIIDYLIAHSVHLKITASRRTKLADYRPPYGKHGHRITINNDLNPYAFLHTLVHEIAHLLTFIEHQRSVKPHGKEWKNNYEKLINKFLNVKIFPQEIEQAIQKYLINPTASSCTSPDLYKVLRKYDPPKIPIVAPNGQQFQKKWLEELPFGQKFWTKNGRIFTKSKLLRKRYECIEVNTQNRFSFSPIAEVYVLFSTT